MKRTSNRNAAIDYLKREFIIYQYDREKDALYFIKSITGDGKASVFFNIEITDDGYTVMAIPNVGDLLDCGKLKFKAPLSMKDIETIGEFTKLFLYIDSYADSYVKNNSDFSSLIADFNIYFDSVLDRTLFFMAEINNCDTPASARKELDAALKLGKICLGGFCEEIAAVLYMGIPASEAILKLKNAKQ